MNCKRRWSSTVHTKRTRENSCRSFRRCRLPEETMKALRTADSGNSPRLIETELPRPIPRAGEVLVRVYAAGVTPAELEWYPTSHTKNGDSRSGAIPSHEFSGEIAEI